jgi:hypothetical protein
MSDDQQTTQGSARTFEELNKEQIGIYAKELNDHFRNERKLRGNLSERDAQLDQRAREVSALKQPSTAAIG